MRDGVGILEAGLGIEDYGLLFSGFTPEFQCDGTSRITFLDIPSVSDLLAP